jgi:hypothetical protein
MGTRADLLVFVGLFVLIWFYSRAMAYFEYRPRRVVRKQFGVFPVPRPERQESKREQGASRTQDDTAPRDTRQREGAFRG